MSARGWPEPPAEPPGFKRTTLDSPTGAQLAVYASDVEGSARAVLCILHDLSEHAARYAEAAVALGAEGIAAVAHDHRGHGATRAPDAPMGVFARKNGLGAVVADAVAVLEHARARHPGAPVITLGLGFGGLVALHQAISRPDAADGLALWNADLRPERERAIRRALALEGLLGAQRPSARMQALTTDAYAKAVGGRTRFDWLSREEAQVDVYVADPLCGFSSSVSLWRDVADGVAAATTAGFGAVPRATPFLLLGGADDPATDGGAAVIALDARLRDMGFTDLSRVILEDGRHATLHDAARREALRVLVRWIDGIVAG